MGELRNCPNCNSLFLKTNLRDVCENCYKTEQKQFDVVYNFIRKSENRMATMDQIVTATDVDEDLIIKWIRSGKLRVAGLPNLGYPCDSCGTLIQKGSVCPNCATNIKQDLYKAEEEKRRIQELRKKDRTYFLEGNKRK
ncbi:TIGR03826 family flagellar region protein [Gottfriedia luciferensis]|uniref:TIGR03826 family flagellar region protein n=1 Tax=Gottfriedia luciferensis TaxID=178774 RepID=UPI000B440255|nr:TIGR03826 family flagellar region protein [Gottfriedia luciferensis]